MKFGLSFLAGSPILQCTGLAYWNPKAVIYAAKVGMESAIHSARSSVTPPLIMNFDRKMRLNHDGTFKFLLHKLQFKRAAGVCQGGSRTSICLHAIALRSLLCSQGCLTIANGILQTARSKIHLSRCPTCYSQPACLTLFPKQV